MKKVFIDGSAGTTGLRIKERLTARNDLELIVLPEEYRKDECARKEAINESDVSILCLPDEAAKEAVSFVTNADVIYTDVWVSMGESESVWEERIHDLTPYRVTDALMENAGEQCVFMHCLPSFHDIETVIGKQIYEKFGIDCMEVTNSVFLSKASIVFKEAKIECIQLKRLWRPHFLNRNRKQLQSVTLL